MTHRMSLRPDGPALCVARLRSWALAITLCALPGCIGAPAHVEPQVDVETPGSFSDAGTEVLADAWWTGLGDPRLTAHVEQALVANRELEGIWHAFREACAVARRAAAERRPVVDLFADGEVTRGSVGVSDEQAAVGGALGYELDLWGRLEATRRAGESVAQASLEDYRTAVVSLTAEVARTWYRLLEAEAQVAVLDEQIASNEQILSLIEARVAAQQLRSVDMLRQETLIESRREARVDADADAQVLRHQMALLTGRAPGAIEAHQDPALATLPPLPDTGVPIESVRRRPDVRAAGQRVMAGDQELGAALRDRFPRLTVQASTGSAAGVFEGFLASFAGGLLAPVFDGERRAAEIGRTRAQRDRLRAEYAQTILEAFRDMEDALVGEARQLRRIASIERQRELTQRSSARLRDEYLNGQGSYIDVLAALTSEQELHRKLLAARRQLLEARIGLYRALAGGSVAGREGRAP